MSKVSEKIFCVIRNKFVLLEVNTVNDDDRTMYIVFPFVRSLSW